MKPKPKLSQQKKTGILGTLTDEFAALDKEYTEDKGGFENKASGIQLKREVTGENSI